MIAARFDRYGPASEIVARDVEDADELAADRIRIRVAYASVNPKDTFVRKGRFRAAMDDRFPKGTGYDWSGVVQRAGVAASGFAAGDAAFGMLGGWEGGTCATTIDVLATEAAVLPSGIGLDVAAAVPLAAQTALQALRDVARLEAGRHVVINGASGGVGSFAISMAKAFGARVTAVASEANRSYCISLGADAFVAYERDAAFAGAGPFDVLFDVFGNASYERMAERLSERGTFVSTVPSAATFASVAATPADDGKRARLVVVTSRTADLSHLATMLAVGKLPVSIAATYPLADVAAAHEHVETKHTRGKVVVRVAP